jgi:acyl dehydratase
MALQQTSVPAVTRERIAAYADAVQDHNPMHLDDAFAKQAGLPSVIAHGPFTVALAIDTILAQRGTPPAGVDARLKAPVFPGEPLQFVPTDTGAELRKDDGTVAVTLIVKDA